jgi:hypothetical protein
MIGATKMVWGRHMPPGTETFDLQATVTMVGQALIAVICNVGFQAATAGLAVACVIAIIGLIAYKQGRRTGKPLLLVARKIAIFCGFLAIPGLLALLLKGQLPPVNQLVLNPLGLIGFWGLVTAHLCMEEMNFQWYLDR